MPENESLSDGYFAHPTQDGLEWQVRSKVFTLWDIQEALEQKDWGSVLVSNHYLGGLGSFAPIGGVRAKKPPLLKSAVRGG